MPKSVCSAEGKAILQAAMNQYRCEFFSFASKRRG